MSEVSESAGLAPRISSGASRGTHPDAHTHPTSPNACNAGEVPTKGGFIPSALLFPCPCPCDCPFSLYTAMTFWRPCFKFSNSRSEICMRSYLHSFPFVVFARLEANAWLSRLSPRGTNRTRSRGVTAAAFLISFCNPDNDPDTCRPATFQLSELSLSISLQSV